MNVAPASGQASVTGSSPIDFTVTFSEAVTGFSTGNVTLGGTAGATTAVVTGSGTTYNVAVSGMTHAAGTVTVTRRRGRAHDALGFGNSARHGSVTYTPAERVGDPGGKRDEPFDDRLHGRLQRAGDRLRTGGVTLSGTAGATDGASSPAAARPTTWPSAA